MDCFYAQVEMIRNPALRNVPLGVQQKYIIVTCNYVARERGVTKLMSVTEAKEKCPDLVLVKGEDLTHYREMSYKVTELLVSYCPLVERLGFDENFMDITKIVEKRLQQSKTWSFKGHVYNTSKISEAKTYPWLAVGSQVAAELREAIHSKLGLTGCAGIATNKLLAKLVSGTFKPNQQTILLPEDVCTIMGSLSSLRKVPGIGHQTAKRLQALGVSSVKDLECFSLDFLVKEFGESSAKRLKALAVGNDDSPVTPTGAPQSLSDEDSFKKMSSIKEVIEKVQELLTSLVERMNSDGRQPQTFRLTIRRYSATNKWLSRESRQCPIPHHVGQKIVTGKCDDAVIQLKSLAVKLFHKMVDTNKAFHLTLINVCFSNLQARASSSPAKNSVMAFFKQTPSPTKMSTDTSQSQIASNSCGGQCAVDQSNSNNYFAEQISKEKVAPISRTCEISHLPPKIDEDVFSCLSQEIQKELISSNSQTNTLQENKNGTQVENLPRNSATVNPLGSTDGPKIEMPGSSEAKIPGNVDPTVFAQLPPELQKELMSEWRQARPTLKAPSSKKLLVPKKQPGKGKKTTGKSGQTNNLLNYFKPD